MTVFRSSRGLIKLVKETVTRHIFNWRDPFYVVPKDDKDDIDKVAALSRRLQKTPHHAQKLTPVIPNYYYAWALFKILNRGFHKTLTCDAENLATQIKKIKISSWPDRTPHPPTPLELSGRLNIFLLLLLVFFCGFPNTSKDRFKVWQTFLN